ncbi:MAG: spermine synthase [Thermoleophilia bacterium]|nr:spermine synthase [Thermoleophilia bacterium]
MRLRLVLPVLVFVAGASTLAAELTGARLLAPWFGASNLVWANVIGLTLIYLSLGYWLGGTLADRHPTPRALGAVVIMAAIALAILPIALTPIFEAAQRAFADLSAGAFVASFVGTMLMFLVPITLLGMVAPWAIRLSVTDVQTAGSVSGRLYAISTLGSILGTFLPVLVLIPAIGTRRTLILIAAVLALSALPLLGATAASAPVVIAALLLLPVGTVKAQDGETVVFEAESPYQYVQVTETPDGRRLLRLNEGWALHSILPADRGALVGGYWDAFATLPLITATPRGRVAILGNAGGTTARAYRMLWPAWHVDGVEIDPVVSRVGRTLLDMSGPNLTVHEADARFWLAADRGPFTGIIVDAYRQPYIPFHLATTEFFRQARNRLARDGVVAINVGTPPDEEAVVARIGATMRTVFPAVLVARYEEFTSVLIAFANPATATRTVARLQAATGVLAGPARQLASGLKSIPGGGEIFTDDRAPVEQMTDGAILNYLNRGAPGA